ncbi:unnamed protein product, partial [Candidula unifasciata]
TNTMKNSRAFVIFLVAIVTINMCFGQIHFTPDWGHGKRSLNPQIDEQSTQPDTSFCLEQLDLNLLFEVSKMLT